MAKVYSFKIFDPESGDYQVPAFKATMELIELENGIAIPESEETVQQHLVKVDGKYHVV